MIILSTDKTDFVPPGNVTVHHRDRSLATETSPVNDLIDVIIREYRIPDDAYIWLLNPTSPFRSKEDFMKIREITRDPGPGSIISVTGLHPFIWQDNKPLFETVYPRKNTQDITTGYNIENGQFIVFKAGEFKKTRTWYPRDTYLFRQDGLQTLFDIDTEDDFLDASNWADAIEETMENETLVIDRLIKKPVQQHVQLIYNHFNRYAKAVQLLEISANDVVIDASCGYGYGSFVLSLKAKEVIGLDINNDYIEKAGQLFSSGNLSIYSYDKYKNIINTDLKANKIVCIETLEHVPKAEMRDFLNGLLNFLKGGGDMFVTVPLGRDQPSSYNEYHLNEPGIEVLYNFFEGLFEKITFEIDTFMNSYGYEQKYCFLTLKYFTGTI